MVIGNSILEFNLRIVKSLQKFFTDNYQKGGEKMSEFEKQVRHALIDKGMTLTELAGELDISISYLYELMKGTRKNEDQKAKIRQVLGIPDIDSDG